MSYLRITLLGLSSLLIAVPVGAQGSISLTTPITFNTPPAIAAYQPGALLVQLVPEAKIVVVLVAGTTQTQTFEYPKDCQAPTPEDLPVCANHDTPAEVATLIGQLNTVNLSTRSLWRRLFDRLVADFPARFPGGATVQ